MKKVLSLFALLLLMSSVLNANVLKENTIFPSDIDDEVDCYDQVYMVTVMADAAGYSIQEVEWFSQVALAIYCHGYSIDDF